MSACAHSSRGLCQGCTFDALLAEIVELRAEKARLLVENDLLRARSVVQPLVDKVREGEDIGSIPSIRLTSDTSSSSTGDKT